MAIIDLMTALMGVAMGFLAFLLVGGISAGIAWALYPGVRAGRPKLKKLLIAILLGFVASLGSSYLGQFTGFFLAGQMLEWVSAIISAWLAGCLYAALIQ